MVHKLAPSQVKAVLHVRLKLGLVVEALVIDQMLVVARDICPANRGAIRPQSTS